MGERRYFASTMSRYMPSHDPVIVIIFTFTEMCEIWVISQCNITIILSLSLTLTTNPNLPFVKNGYPFFVEKLKILYGETLDFQCRH